jgi:hypothetical protein
MRPMALTWEIQSLSSIHRKFLTQAMGDYVSRQISLTSLRESLVSGSVVLALDGSS